MNLRNSVLPAICLVLLSFSAAPAHADTYTYIFSGVNSGEFGDGLSVSFQYSSQTPVNGLTQLLASQLTSCTNCLMSSTVPAVEFNPGNTSLNNILGFVDINQTEYFYHFPTGAFLSPGTYVTTNTSPFPGTLSVIVTPEPSSIVLCLSGMSGIMAIRRRRRTMNN